MQAIREVGPRVGRDVSFSRDIEKVHVLEGSYYLVGAELLPGTVHLLREVLVYDERKEAGEEVCGDAVVPSKEDGTRLELRFGEPAPFRGRFCIGPDNVRFSLRISDILLPHQA